MKIALVDSGLGLLAAAAAVRRLRPDAALVLSGDPAGMPWGPRTTDDITARALACARAAAAHGPDALIVACNTASVHALPALRAALEPAIPVVGTVPAVKPAAVAGGPLAVWATPATTGSPYQRELIARFAGGLPTAEVPCHGLADAVEGGDPDAIATAVRRAAALTPPTTRDVVLGCTHYELVAPLIRERVRAVTGRPVRLHGSAQAVAAQALRRVGAPAEPDGAARGGLLVLAGGEPCEPPAAMLGYAEGRLLLPAPGPAAPAVQRLR